MRIASLGAALVSLSMVMRPLAAQRPAPTIHVVDMIPAQFSGETNQDSEPFLAVNPATPDVMAASAFTADPAGAPNTAPIFVSRNGGLKWTLNSIVRSDQMTADISHAFSETGASWFAGILSRPMPSNDTVLKELNSLDVTSSTLSNEQATRNHVDQPFVVAANGRVYVGSNDFGASQGRTASVDVSLDGGKTYAIHRIETRKTSGQDGPSVRLTTSKDGTVYAALLAWRSTKGSDVTADVVVVRDDKGAVSASAFADLKDPSDSLAGRIVAKGVTIPWVNGAAIGNQRIGSTLSIAADPNNSATVYVAWGDRAGNGDIYTIHVRRSSDRGVTWSSDVRTLKNAVNVALAVADNGTIGLLYQQLDGTGAATRWSTRLEQTRNAFQTQQASELTRALVNHPSPQFQPYLGDYIMLIASGAEFRGVYSASNAADKANFPQGLPTYQRKADFTNKKLLDGAGGTVGVSIDPFYASVPVMTPGVQRSLP